MGINPREMRKLVEQAQKMQSDMAAAQNELAAATFEGSAGGGVVTATVSGGQELLAVSISRDVIDPEDPEMLGDLVVAAVNTALRAAGAAAQERLGGVTGGLDLGGLIG